MLYIFYFFALVSIWLGALSLRGGWRFFDFAKRAVEQSLPRFQPFASIIAPCRGLDADLSANLGALFAQDYANYEIIFVVDDERDAAVSIIEELIRANRTVAKIVVAGRAVECGQKVHNLRRAVTQVSPHSEIFVFVDSDARPNAAWLAHLVAPLIDANIGATTGYRWFIAAKNNLAGELRAVWNASIASALGANERKNFCWGGATAIRRETFERLQIRKKWRGALSDDFALTDALQTAKLPVRFVPQCLTVANDKTDFAQTLEFTTRQLKITRVYAAPLWKAVLIGNILFALTFWGGIALTIWRAFQQQSIWLPLILLTLIFALGAGKSWIRLRAVKTVLPAHQQRLNQSLKWHLTLWTLTPVLFAYNAVAAGFSRRIVWRGIEYEMKSPRETVITLETRTK